MSEFILDVSGMTCVNCERLVEESLEYLRPVDGASANATNDCVQVEAPPKAVEDVRLAIEDLGFDVDV